MTEKQKNILTIKIIGGIVVIGIIMSLKLYDYRDCMDENDDSIYCVLKIAKSLIDEKIP